MSNKKVVINFGASMYSQIGPGVDCALREFPISHNDTYPALPRCDYSYDDKAKIETIKNYSDFSKKEFSMLDIIVVPLERQGLTEYSIRLVPAPTLKRWVAFIHSSWTEQSHLIDECDEGPYEPDSSCKRIINFLYEKKSKKLTGSF